jgi:hypothetical protein
MQKFNGQNLLEFIEHFQSDHDCKEYLANIKWRVALSVSNVSIMPVKYVKIIQELAINVAIQNRLQHTHYFIK